MATPGLPSIWFQYVSVSAEGIIYNRDYQYYSGSTGIPREEFLRLNTFYQERVLNLEVEEETAHFEFIDETGTRCPAKLITKIIKPQINSTIRSSIF